MALFILWSTMGLVLWLGAIGLFLMACAIPATWVPDFRQLGRVSTPVVAQQQTPIVSNLEEADGNSSSWTAVPVPSSPDANAPITFTLRPMDMPQLNLPQEAETIAGRVLVPATDDGSNEGKSPGNNPVGTPDQAAPPLLIQTGGIVDAQFIDSYSIESINALSRNFYPETNFLAAHYAVDRYQLRFQTLNQAHTLSTIRAELFVPRVALPTQFPLLVYGSGTTGIGNKCAPLDELTRGRNWGSYRTHMLSYSAQGYIAILPLWQGYDDLSSTHPYFVAELEGPVMLDATRAVYRFFDSDSDLLAQPAAAVFFGGYSQGSHGAFAADAMAPAYASELPIKGIIGHAGAPSVEALMREAPSLAPYIIYAFREYYGRDVVDPVSVFRNHWLPTFDGDASSKCVDEVYDYYHGGEANLYQPRFSQSLYSKRLGFDFPAFKEALDRNDSGAAVNPQIPALLLHGSADPIVTPQTNERFMRQLCRQGKPVTYYLYNNVHHFQTRQYSFVDTIKWMQAILTGAPVRADCSTILAQ